MNGHQQRRSRRGAGRRRALILLAASVLFAGLFMQISMLSRISAQIKRAAALEKEISELSASAENLELCINQYHNLDSIAARARQLGMQKPDASQIRVVRVEKPSNENTSVQAAEAADGLSAVN